MALGDLHLFLHRVAGNLDDLHPVAQCGLDGGEAVGGGEEHDLREVVVELEVVVVKRAVLFGVQHLEHGRGGVAVQVPAQLVDFVEDEERVGGARLLQVLDDPARHGADVGLAVAPDFGFIPHAAEGHADILPAQRLGDGLAERGLADARRAVQANDGGLHVALQLEHGEVLDDALLDLFQSIVVLIEDLLGVGEVEVVLGGDVPGQVEQEVQIIGLHAVLGALGVHPLELADFLGKRFRDLLGPILEFGAGFLARDVLLVGVGPEFLLDLLHLLVQEELALLLLDVGLDPALDVVLELEHLQFLAEEFHHLFDPFLEAFHLQEPLFLLLLRVHVGGDEVDEKTQGVDVLDGDGRLRGEVGAVLDHLHAHFLEALLKRLLLGVRPVFRGVREGRDLGPQVGLLAYDLAHPATALALDDHRVRSVGHPQHLDDAGHRADVVKVGGRRIFHLSVLLGHDPDVVSSLIGLLEQLEALVPADVDGEHHTRKEDGVAQRQDGQVLRGGFAFHRGLILRTQQRNAELVVGLVGKKVVQGNVFKHRVGEGHKSGRNATCIRNGDTMSVGGTLSRDLGMKG